MRPITRIEPQGPSEAYKTYQINRPATTHFRIARCEEVNCPRYLGGFRSKLDESNEQERKFAWLIRNKMGRPYKEQREGPITTFTFEAGTQCFAVHRVPLDRPAIYSVRDGDWRTSDNRRHLNAEDWLDDFKNNQDKVSERLERG